MTSTDVTDDLSHRPITVGFRPASTPFYFKNVSVAHRLSHRCVIRHFVHGRFNLIKIISLAAIKHFVVQSLRNNRAILTFQELKKRLSTKDFDI